MKVFLSTCLLSISVIVYGQNIEKIKVDELNAVINTKSEQIKVINFWASWCGPCVKELPYFSAISDSGKAEVTLVSLDFPQELSKAKSLLEKKKINLDSYLLDEDDYIDRIEKSWSGAIPATIIINSKGERSFYEKSFTNEELNILITSISQNE